MLPSLRSMWEGRDCVICKRTDAKMHCVPPKSCYYIERDLGPYADQDPLL